ncbi:FMN-dependent NADH-azoreductase [Algibacter lectus]|uniref:FMN-dependent NADH-azoreductase n=1 Tax=Algibacter lectus TaxID=221126 RepID=UPI0008EC7EC5|nr:NAD(P)H-dependent oxidoreductase [Algibacter lectus]SFB91489.1 FMN-dependent NADH-azoreductase [Algibacter lectus]
MNILKINSSVRTTDSISRQLVEELVDKLKTDNSNIIERDLRLGIPLLTQEMVTAFNTPIALLNNEHRETLSISDKLLTEIDNSDVLVLGVPMYNFSIPGSLKAYFDLIARVGKTFKYTENGPIGLLKNKKAYIIMVSGGAPFGSLIDFASVYVKHFLGFLGITDVEFILADQLNSKGQEPIELAQKKNEALAS